MCFQKQKTKNENKFNFLCNHLVLKGTIFLTVYLKKILDCLKNYICLLPQPLTSLQPPSLSNTCSHPTSVYIHWLCLYACCIFLQGIAFEKPHHLLGRDDCDVVRSGGTWYQPPESDGGSSEREHWGGMAAIM